MRPDDLNGNEVLQRQNYFGQNAFFALNMSTTTTESYKLIAAISSLKIVRGGVARSAAGRRHAFPARTNCQIWRRASCRSVKWDYLPSRKNPFNPDNS
jgi:hypothetical protein